MKRFYPVMSALLLTLFGADAMVAAQDKVVIRVDGGTLLADPVDDYAKLFAGEDGKCAVTVSGSSTGKGFQKLISGECELAMMTRPTTEAENKAASDNGVVLGNKMFGYIALAIITNSRNPVKELTLEQVHSVFTGKITNWAALGGPNEAIKVLTRPVPATGSGVL
jgi:phosphate transport system substrate-binding protein